MPAREHLNVCLQEHTCGEGAVQAVGRPDVHLLSNPDPDVDRSHAIVQALDDLQ